MSTDVRDIRDLQVLALRQDGLTPSKIARALGLPTDVVDTILALDADEFPDEPLMRRRRA